ncbi:unnamed protein product [Protopolystoma xenopodis]|uniref:Uncharacterized protein n=1 Tax=Protopolystoma xenopodis TaxID=117903 RepID=A0A3S5C6H1_9PLAT|nr:unnamed protein product [Protopolystoma xenopodis]
MPDPVLPRPNEKPLFSLLCLIVAAWQPAAGSTQYLYNLITCRLALNGNQDNSYLTVISQDGLMFGIINIIGELAVVRQPSSSPSLPKKDRHRRC